MGIREIEIFRVVMTTGSTSKAASMLGISQPAVSQAIRKLEAGASLQFFERARGRLVPTQEAQALMEDVDRFFVGFETIEHRIKSLSRLGTGRLSVAAHPAMGNAFMPRALAAFGFATQDVKAQLKVLSSKDVHQQVSSGQCDFGLMADEMPVMGLEHSVFLDEPGVVAIPAGHALSRQRFIEPADFDREDFLALNPEDSSRIRLEHALQNHGVTLKPKLETPYAHTLCELVVQGMGIGFINPIAACDFLDRGLVIRPFRLDVRFRSLLLFRPGKPLPEIARKLLSSMRIQLQKDLKRLNQALPPEGTSP